MTAREYDTAIEDLAADAWQTWNKLRRLADELWDTYEEYFRVYAGQDEETGLVNHGRKKPCFAEDDLPF